MTARILRILAIAAEERITVGTTGNHVIAYSAVALTVGKNYYFCIES